MWDWQPTVLIGCVDLLLAYVVFVRPLTARAWLFGTGVLVLALALLSPLDTLGDLYLFSLHMLQHLLLILVVPPLLVLGIPPDVWARILRRAPARQIEQLVGRPLIAWLLGMGTLWLWHVPILYDTAVTNESIHIVQHVSFLVTATIFWWPVLTPYAERRLAMPANIFYLLAATFASSILGVLITFAPPGLYTAYKHPVDPFGALGLIRQGWGLSYALDQQLGGLIMWVAGGPFYLVLALWALIRWFGEPEESDIALPSRASTATSSLRDHTTVERITA
jgi:cytochrome c oxidase assembly factor CtaG